MANKKIYEIAFQLGAKMNSSVRTAFANTNKNLSNVSKNAQDASKNAILLGESLKGVVRVGLAGAAISMAGIAAGAAAAVSSADQFRDSMNQIEAATGVSAAEMAKIDRNAKDLYKQNLGENWADVADAISNTRSVTGLTGEALESATKNALIYRDVFKEDVAESVKTVDTMMKNFGISNDQAFNLLAQGAQNGLNKSKELLDTANEYAPHFAALGMSANDMFNTFSSGLDAGAFNLDKVGDAVKEFNIRSKDGSKTSTEAFQALNMNAAEMTRIFAAGGPQAQKAFRQVMKAISDVEDPVKKNQIGVALMGTMYEDLEAGVVEAMGNARNQFDMTRQTMEQIGKVKYDSVGKVWQGIRRQLETGVLIPLGDRVLPKLQEFSTYIQTNMPQIEASVMKAMETGKKWLDKFGNAVQWARNNSDNLTLAAGFLVGTFVAFKVISTVTKLMAAYRAITAGATLAQYALNLAMNMNPIGVISMLIGGLVMAGIALWQNWDTVKAKGLGLWQMFRDNWEIIVAFTGPIGALIVAGVKLAQNWDTVWGSIKSNTVGSVNTVIKAINTMIGGLNKFKIDIPEWVNKIPGVPNMKSFGFNIPQIPMLANGGITTGPTLAMIGEGREQEAVLPLSKLQWLLDRPPGNTMNNQNEQSINIEYKPTYVIQGNADKETIEQANLKSYQEFKRWMQRYHRERGRLSFEGE
ncbi:phage tail tape measure protein [Paenibacillus naphthalenovorans]|uniref:phage tail tape measure protein n=1 Tax=Paenibacillus naphthalenovorans TaxID=162209 RepID=UPI003D2D2488